jgi:hypothetical protein
MIKRLNEQQKAIKEFANRYNIDDLTRNEWSLLQQLEKLLAPAEEASRFVCQDDSPLSVQIAMAKKLVEDWQNMICPGFGIIQDVLIECLREKFDEIESNR